MVIWQKLGVRVFPDFSVTHDMALVCVRCESLGPKK